MPVLETKAVNSMSNNLIEKNYMIHVVIIIFIKY